ncbi:uncharacterized protein FIESC28_07261 [Fusarium coffeatum]|uniref:Uncharacterized protein n=1 Tax=Fusarium coffeatum TaxID=231269 RepID=A0A366RGW6_9HYPO|nr:uncharacterized protein FIESC28_07261 [Fusarium coffeatum]RBR15620.1 hypothetical protein FIESC28_07261 [Fusarium coffeatum]
MRDIYARAQRVIVFLGDGSYFRIPQDYAKSPPPAPMTFSTFTQDAPLISDFHNNWETLCRRPEWYSFCAICVLRLLEDVDGYSDTLNCIATGKASSKLRLFELVRQFMNSQWWQRVWVVQEATVTSEVVIQYGNVRIPWPMLATAAGVCEKLGWGRHDVGSESFLGIEREYAKVLPPFARQVFEVERSRREWKTRKGTGLLSLLQEFSGRKATDDRDKVFALLGLASDIRSIKPNYSLSTVQVHRRTVIDLIKHSGTLIALSGDMKRKNSRDIPSWIPDWSVAIEEPDRRRMHVEAARKISPRWEIQLVESEEEYWERVAINVNILHEEIEAGKRRPLPDDIVASLISYETILRTRTYGSELMLEETLDSSQEEAIQLCKVMYTEFKENVTKFWLSTPIRRFIKAHLALPLTPSSGEYYRMDIIKCCAKIYCSKILDLWVQRLRERYNTLLVSYEEQERIVWDHYWYFPDGWTWDEYIRMTFPTLVRSYRNKVYTKGELAESEILSLLSTPSEATAFLERERVFIDSMTFTDPQTNSGGIGTFESLPELVNLSSEVLNLRTGTDILQAVQRVRYACKDLINSAHNNVIDPELDYTTLFSTSVVFLESSSWMRCLRDNRPQKFDFDDQMFLESRRQRQRAVLSEGANILHISTKHIATVGDCSERLITWVDSASRIFTISQWAVLALKSKTRDFALRFATTLVGGLYEESPGKFRQLRRPEEDGLLWSWFESSVLPRLCAVNTAVNNQQFTWLMDGKTDGKIESDIKKSFDTEMRLATEGRVFFTTKDHGMGLGPASMMPQDQVDILPGGTRPFVLRLRPWNRGSPTVECEVVGDCFFMRDEVEHNEGEEGSLQGCLPVEILGGLLSSNVVRKDITLV